MMNKDTTLAIVGLGLLGGSYAKGLKTAGYHVLGIARREETITYALDHHYIDEGSCDPSLVQHADIIICCLYPSILLNWIQENLHYFKEGALICDISGVKHTIVEPIQRLLENTTNEFIATHPMAGRETSGIEYANTEMFETANFIIVPTEHNTQHAIDTMWDIANILHFHHISTLSIEEHDRMIAFLSQLTHVIAVCLMNTHDDDKLVDYTGDSFRDLTRIANINETMWSELFLYNKDTLLTEISKFQSSLATFKATLENEDREAMEKLFIQSSERRKKFN